MLKICQKISYNFPVIGHYDTVEENIIEEEQEVKISSRISSHTKESSVQIYEEEEVKYVAEEKDQPEVESEPEIETEFIKEKVFDSTHLSDDLEERSEDDKPVEIFKAEEKTEVDSRRSISPEVVPKSISPEVEVPEVEEKEIIMDYSREYSTQSSHTSYQKEPEMEETFEAVVTKEIEVQPVVMEEPEVEEAKPEVETEDKKESSSGSISDEDEVARPISQEIVEPSTTEPEIVVQETEIKSSQMSMPPPPEILVQPSPEVEDEPEPEVDDEPSKFTEFTESTIHESATSESISKEDVLDTIATTTTESHEISNTDEANKRYSSTYSEASVEDKSEADSQELETKPEPEVKEQPEPIEKISRSSSSSSSHGADDQAKDEVVEVARSISPDVPKPISPEVEEEAKPEVVSDSSDEDDEKPVKKHHDSSSSSEGEDEIKKSEISTSDYSSSRPKSSEITEDTSSQLPEIKKRQDTIDSIDELQKPEAEVVLEESQPALHIQHAAEQEVDQDDFFQVEPEVPEVEEEKTRETAAESTKTPPPSPAANSAVEKSEG